jgi:hypothetical protein
MGIIAEVKKERSTKKFTGDLVLNIYVYQFK